MTAMHLGWGLRLRLSVCAEALVAAATVDRYGMGLSYEI